MVFTTTVNVILVLRIHALYDQSKKGMSIGSPGCCYVAANVVLVKVLIFMIVMMSCKYLLAAFRQCTAHLIVRPIRGG